MTSGNFEIGRNTDLKIAFNTENALNKLLMIEKVRL